jgi:hypothetical protein
MTMRYSVAVISVFLLIAAAGRAAAGAAEPAPALSIEAQIRACEAIPPTPGLSQGSRRRALAFRFQVTDRYMALNRQADDALRRTLDQERLAPLPLGRGKEGLAEMEARFARQRDIEVKARAESAARSARFKAQMESFLKTLRPEERHDAEWLILPRTCLLSPPPR